MLINCGNESERLALSNSAQFRQLFELPLGLLSESEEARPSVLLIVDSSEPRLLRQLRDELNAFGFDSTVEDAAAQPGTAREVQELAESRHSAADLWIRPSTRGVEVWVADRMTGKTIMRDMPADNEQTDLDEGYRLLAIQTVELLRASLLEIQLAQRPIAPVSVPPEIETRVNERQKFFDLGIGLGTIWAPGELSPSLQIDVLAAVRPWMHWQFGVLASFPVLSTELSGEGGVAQIRKSRLGGFARYRFAKDDAFLIPWAGFGIDAWFTQIGAEAASGFTAGSDSTWGALFRGEVGAILPLSSQVNLGLDFWLGATSQQIVIRFDGVPEATIGPLLLGSALRIEVEL